MEKLINGKINREAVLDAYSGRKEGCRCGCLGKYFYTKKYQERAGEERGYAVSNDEISETGITRVVNKINKAIEEKKEVDFHKNYINYDNNGHPVTIYFHPEAK